MLDFLPYLSALLTFISVWLAIREQVSSWWVGIVAVVVAAIPLVMLGLWGQCLLQVVYFTSNLFGWYAWHKGRGNNGIGVGHAGWKHLLLYALLTSVCYGLLINLHHLLSPLTITEADAVLTAVSLSAQVALAQKKIESWCLWIAIDVWSTWWFYTLDQGGFVLMFGGLTGIAAYALFDWNRQVLTPVKV